VQDGVHLEGAVEVCLAIEDGDVDIRTAGEKFVEIGRRLNCHALIASFSQLLVDLEELGARQRDSYYGAWHDCDGPPCDAEAEVRV
jgi:hypothetical protein